MISTLTLIQQEKEKQLQDQMEMENPLALFMYALRTPETRRQWPRRLKTFLDFLEMEGSIILRRTSQDIHCQDSCHTGHKTV
ncbi:MAG: hypothetical protein WBW34_01315 [Nitrososphaeraceae archaeon]